MKTTFVSTFSIGEATRNSIARAQTNLTRAQTELSTGQLQDAGRELGATYGSLVGFRQEHAELGALRDSNSQVAAQLDVAQLSLQSLVDGAKDFVAQLVGAQQVGLEGNVLQQLGEAGLATLTDRVNVQYNGAYVFAGTNTGAPPLVDYFQSGGSAAKSAMDSAFAAEFGFNSSDPRVAEISGAEMSAYIGGSYSAVFDDANWQANWSSASDTVPNLKISSYETVRAPASANESAFSKLASAYAAAADFGTENLGSAARQVMASSLAELASEAIDELGALQAGIGTSQERIPLANDRLGIQQSILSNSVSELNDVDPFEASTRLTTLLTQVETSYSVTARINQMSILNYL
ncbi:MAG: flagellar hook-associated family protein [Pseudomonadota bacterium]